MENLTLEQLAPYLPYNLKVQSKLDGIYELSTYSSMDGNLEKQDIYSCLSNNYKPILRPLLDLTKTIEVNGKKFIPIDKLDEMYGQTISLNETRHLIRPITCEPYILIRQLFEWHFDVFSLIKNNLAININTL